MPVPMDCQLVMWIKECEEGGNTPKTENEFRRIKMITRMPQPNKMKIVFLAAYDEHTQKNTATCHNIFKSNKS